MEDDVRDAEGHSDPTVAEVARLFREHPAWRRAAGYIGEGCTSAVWFRHRPGEPWHLVRMEEGARLKPGAPRDPDFVFRFSPGAVRDLSDVEGGMDEFAVCLFARMIDPDPERHVDFRVVSPFWRLARRGYVRLLLAAGPRVAAFGASHGLTGLADLRRLVRSLRRGPFDFEES